MTIPASVSIGSGETKRKPNRPSRTQADRTRSKGDDRRVTPVARAQLLYRLLDIPVDRRRADAELGRDFLRRAAFPYQAQALPLAGAQTGRGIGGHGRPAMTDEVYRSIPACEYGCRPCDIKCSVIVSVRDARWRRVHQLMMSPRSGPAAPANRSEDLERATARWEASQQAAELARPAWHPDRLGSASRQTCASAPQLGEEPWAS